MPIRFACPTCRATLEAPESKGGHKINCPRCQQRLLIPPATRNKTILGEPLPPALSGRRDPKPPREESPAGNLPAKRIDDDLTHGGACPFCLTVLLVPHDLLGETVLCPKCASPVPTSGGNPQQLDVRPDWQEEPAEGRERKPRRRRRSRGGQQVNNTQSVNVVVNNYDGRSFSAWHAIHITLSLVTCGLWLPFYLSHWVIWRLSR